MREIEVKFKVLSRETLLEKLREMGVELGQPVHQTDYLFVHPGTEYPPVPAGFPVYRIRVENNKNSLITLKIPQKNSVGSTNSQDCKEYETTIGDPEVMFAFLRALHLETLPTVSKKRIKGKIGDIEICIDEVEKLGTFIEAEKIVNDDRLAEETQETLRVFLESLGISRDCEIHNGKYDVMMYEKYGNSTIPQ